MHVMGHRARPPAPTPTPTAASELIINLAHHHFAAQYLQPASTMVLEATMIV